MGMAGMAIAILATLLQPRHVGRRLPADHGRHRHRRRHRRDGVAPHPDDALPQLVAAFHSLVGLAAVFVAAAALNAPEAFGIGTPGHIFGESLVEMSLGLAIGAVTFSGSLIAFAKLQALMKGTPITFKYQHPLNAALGVLLLVLIVLFVLTGQPIRVLADRAAGDRRWASC